MSQCEDLTGQRFTRLTVKSRIEGAVKPMWLCLCDCGNQCRVVGESLRSGNTRSCGCLRKEARGADLTGEHFGFWMAIARAGRLATARRFGCANAYVEPQEPCAALT